MKRTDSRSPESSENQEQMSELEELPADQADELAEQGESSTGSELVAELEAERDSLKDRLLRTAAELDNYRKRTRRELEQARSQGVAELALPMIDVLDNLERALDAATEEERSSSIAQGIEMVRSQFLDCLESLDVRRLDPVGQPFDPHFHDALMEEERDDLPAGTVIDELVRGYCIGDRLLRASQVRVSKASAEAGTQPDPETDPAPGDSSSEPPSDDS